MKVVKQGSGQQGWSVNAVCTGKGNGGGGCGAELLVEEPDLYQTSRSDYTGDTDYFVTFSCSECGVETDLENVPSSIQSKLKGRKKPMKKQKPVLGQRNVPISVFIASTSKIKIEAIKSLIAELESKTPAIHAFFYSVEGSSSGVNEQPVGEDEILTGAINRALSAKRKDPRGEVYVAIENGIEFNEESGDWRDYAIVLAFVPSYGVISYVKSKAVTFPIEQVQKTYAKEGSFAVHTVGKTLQEDGIVRKHDDPHLDLAGVSRTEILKDALKELINYLPQGLFLRNPAN